MTEQQLELLTSVEYAILASSQNEYILELQRQVTELKDNYSLYYQQVQAQGQAHEDALEQWRIRYEQLSEAFDASEKEITFER